MVARHSPCVGVCALDERSGYCFGCGRDRREIGDWMVMSEAERDAVWLTLPPRLSRLGVPVRLLPWTSDEIIGFVAKSIAERQGIWVLGGFGTSARFAAADERPEVIADSETVLARSHGIAFRLRLTDKVRAFAFSRSRSIALALPTARARLKSPDADGVQRMDVDAIDEDARSVPYHPLDGQNAVVRWGIRAEQANGIPSGMPLPGALSYVGSGASPASAVICETAIARIEIAIGAVDGTIRQGSDNFVEAGNGTLPSYATEVATFHPQNRPDG